MSYSPDWEQSHHRPPQQHQLCLPAPGAAPGLRFVAAVSPLLLGFVVVNTDSRTWDLMLVLGEKRPLAATAAQGCGFLVVLCCSQTAAGRRGRAHGKPFFSVTDLWLFDILLRSQQLSCCTDTIPGFWLSRGE